MKAVLAAVLSALLCIQTVSGMPEKTLISYAENQEETKEEVEITAPSAILMEASTGKVIYEKSPDEERPPASVTKIMTLLLIFDALDSGKITLEDQVSVSEYAASMGGSQVFLEPGETQSVDTMIKCIAVASANDACEAYRISKNCGISFRMSKTVKKGCLRLG